MEIAINKRSLQVKGEMCLNYDKILSNQEVPIKIEVSENIHFLTSCNTFIASGISIDSAGNICSNFNSRNMGSSEWQ